MSARKIVLWVILTLGTLALIVLISFTIFRDYHPTPKQAIERAVAHEDSMEAGLPTSFVFIEDRGNGYRLYKDEFGYYLVWHDTTYAASTHITFLGKAR
jgi:hypothetical protein